MPIDEAGAEKPPANDRSPPKEDLRFRHTLETTHSAGQRSIDGVRLVLDHLEQDPGRSIRPASALLPLLHRGQREPVAVRELRLREAEPGPDRLDVDLLRHLDDRGSPLSMLAAGVGRRIAETLQNLVTDVPLRRHHFLP